MTDYKFGDIVLVHFPQSGSAATKQRPGVVIHDIGDQDAVIVPIASKARSQAGDLAVADLQGTGLIRPSWMRAAKASTLLKADLIRTLGRLASADRAQLATTWRSLFDGFVT
jgi:mRNA interferase MazF